MIPVLQGSQTITFRELPWFSYFEAHPTRTFILDSGWATASSGLPVSFSSLTPSICTVVGDVVTLIAGGGNCTFAGNQSGNASFMPAPQATQSFLVRMQTQSITISAVPDKNYGDTPFAVTASSTSGLAMTLSSSTTGVCTLAGNVVSLVSVGTCTLLATQAGTAYLDTASQTLSFTVSIANQTITFAALPNKMATDLPFALTASASSGLPVSYTTVGTCLVSGNTLTLTGAGGCIVYADQPGNGNYNPAAQVTRNFNILPVFTLTVAKAGTGTGTITSNPAGINCGSTCSSVFATGTQVTLGIAASPGSNFTGWSGVCTGLATCIVTMDAAKSVTATFQPATVDLTVTRTGSGTGNILSAPTGVDCGVACIASFSFGSTVTLTPTPSAGSQFTAWSGACIGTGACMVTMDAAKLVTATFTLTTLAQSVSTMVFNPTTVTCGVAAPWTATVSGNAGTPTGTVTLRTSGGTSLGNYSLNGGIAGSSLTFQGYNGVASYYVDYNGNATYATSQSAPASITVAKATPGVALTSTGNPSALRASITLTATVSRVGACSIPGGTVTFLDGAVVLGNATLDASGVATLTTSTLANGTHSLTAQYSGGTFYVPANSPALVQTVKASSIDAIIFLLLD